MLVLIDGSDSTASAQALASVNGVDRATATSKASRGDARTGARRSRRSRSSSSTPTGAPRTTSSRGSSRCSSRSSPSCSPAIAIVRERERGTLEQLLVTPIDPLGLMLGKLGPYLLLGLVEMALILVLMRFVFGVPIRGQPRLPVRHGGHLHLRAARARLVHLDARADAARGAAEGADAAAAVVLPLRLHLPVRGPAARSSAGSATASRRLT